MKKIYFGISVTTMLILVAATGFTQGVGDHFTMSLDSCRQTDQYTVQFDLMIVSDGAAGSDLRLNSCQWGINFNTGCLQSGATFTQAGSPFYFPGTSDFIPPLNGFVFPPNQSEIRIVQSPFSGANTGATMVLGHKYRVGRFKISSSSAIVCNCNLNFILQPDTGSLAGKTPTVAIAWIGTATSTTSFLSPGTGSGTVALGVNCSLTLNPNDLTVTATSTPTCLASNTGTATAFPNSINDSLCGGCFQPYNYSWSPSGQTDQQAVSLSAGTYTVTVTNDALCTATTTVTVTQDTTKAPVIKLSNTGDTLICTQTYVSYQWYCNGVPIPGATSKYYVATSACVYKVMIVDFLNCPLFSNDITVGIEPIDNLLSEPMSVFPNPTNGSSVTLSYSLLKPADVSIALYNSVGQQIKTLVNEKQATGKHEIISDLKKMPSGIYFIKTTVDGNASMMKMVRMD